MKTPQVVGAGGVHTEAPPPPRPDEHAHASRHPIRHLVTRVAGVTHNNDDGTNRQTIIIDCHHGERVQLQPQKFQSAILNAVAVHRQTGQQIGYIPADLAPALLREAASGYSLAAYVKGIKGISPMGVELVILACPRGTTSFNEYAYIERHLGWNFHYVEQPFGGVPTIL